MQLLYHYTNIRTLCAIVNGMQNNNMFLRAGNAKNMNDPNDCYYFANVLGEILNTSQNEIEQLYKDKNKYDCPYLISLSRRKDDLHMWNCYGEDGYGIAFGIKNLPNIVSDFFLTNHISAHLYDCKYMDSKAIKRDKRFMTIAKDKKSLDKNFWNNDIISDISNIIKHPCYRYEKEARVVIKHGEKEITINDVYRKDEDAFYVAIPLSCVKEIIVGPNANLETIKKIFSQYFPYTKFKESTIPYRSK